MPSASRPCLFDFATAITAGREIGLDNRRGLSDKKFDQIFD
jgi:hypothetical protein